MAARSSAVTDTENHELVIKRIFNAPRAMVWKAWTDPEHLMRWWGPHGFTTTSCKMDVRPGGSWRITMKSPQGREDRQRGVFREVVEPERLIFTYAFEDEAGNAGHEMIVSVSFAERGESTELTIHQTQFETVAVRDDHVRGWNEALDHLATLLAKR
ncbi:MAG TPA: SRPBCC domain-containing protein [Candidatus Acidoferrales bacterium]|nr:SRPBCC domain-containing protein [Candidatus Acidoferrales bacterium]